MEIEGDVHVGIVNDAPGLAVSVAFPQGRIRRGWAAISGALSGLIGAVMGLLPHLLHHVGFLIGAGVLAGAAGNIVFGVLGIVFSIPLLRRLYRRYGTWKAPAAGLAVFAAMFALSAFVLGPWISSSGSTAQAPVPVISTGTDHAAHHPG